ncbi:MAG: class I SAM-dependent methyltransferase [Proteobacteria bacterium]|nr:class I SAM-dependent methyltransferase [Pseudomonadota bacterium]MBW3616164.1 class I SAM-dependent methyltransferase [Pseudomonadota bacterium]
MPASLPQFAPDPVVMRTRAWADYALLDSGGGRKLERFGPHTVVRPEPQCVWAPADAAAWARADATFDPSASDEDEAGRWRFRREGEPGPFPLVWGGVRFKGRFTAFRHLGFFPEQAANWGWLDGAVRAMPRGAKVLNLFGYTGVASLVCAAAGAAVTHVDASKRAVGWARENAALSGMEALPTRWIVEDARKYVAREVKRGSRYHGIILDPPKYGRGPGGETWKLFEDLPGMLADCATLLEPDAGFLLLNGYAERLSGLSLGHAMAGALGGRGGRIDWGELALEEDRGGRAVGLSFFARWTR